MDRQQAISKLMGDINRRYGDGSLMLLGQADKMKVEAISTGCLTLDLALGIGGLPRGRITEIYGPESSGKTTLAIHLMAQAQRQGGEAAIVDMEHAFDPEYGQRLGLDPNHLYVSQPDNGEQALEIVEALVRSGALDVVVLDSVAALVPSKELEGDMGDAVMGLQARLMSQALRKLAGAISTSRTTVLFTNQLRQKIGVMFGNPETTPGGLALKFYASVRLDIRRIQNLKVGEEIIGGRTRISVVKNKVAPPFRTAEFDVLYNEGISHAGEVLDIGTSLEVITKRGAFYSFGDQRLGQGRDNARVFLKGNPAVMEQIESVIRERGARGEIPFKIEGGFDD